MAPFSSSQLAIMPGWGGKPSAAGDAPKLRRDDKAFLDHLNKINDTFYDQIRIADQKAAYIFTFMVAFLVTSAEGRAVFAPARYQSGMLPQMVLSALLAAAVVVSLVCAILVVLPRNRSGGSSLYWNGWAQNREKFLGALERDEPSWLFDEYLANVDALSAISRTKYRFVAGAFRALLVTVLAFCLLLAWGVPTLPIR
jgi:hypothetical protein